MIKNVDKITVAYTLLHDAANSDKKIGIPVENFELPDPTPDELFAELVKHRPCERCSKKSGRNCTSCRWFTVNQQEYFTPRPTGKTLDELKLIFNNHNSLNQLRIDSDAWVIVEKKPSEDYTRWHYRAEAMGYVERGGLWVKGDK